MKFAYRVLISFSKSFKEHLGHIREVVQRLRAHGIKLKAEKCKLFQKEINYLEQIVSSDCYKPDTTKVSAETVMITSKSS